MPKPLHNLLLVNASLSISNIEPSAVISQAARANPSPFHYGRRRATGAGICRGGHLGGGNLDEETVKRWFVTELRNRDVLFLNAKADLHAAMQWNLDPEALGIRPHDVAFMSAMLNSERQSRTGRFGFSLEELAEYYLPEGERKVHPANVAPEDFYKAAASEIAERGISDAFLTYRLFEVMQPEITDQDLQKVLDLEDSIIYAVVGMERNGFRVDRAKVEQWQREIPGHVSNIHDEILAATGIDLTARGRKCMYALFRTLGLKVPRVYDKKQWKWRDTFDAPHLQAIDHPVMRRVVGMRKLETLQSMYLGKYLEAMDSNNVIHFQLNQLKGDEGSIITGRFSSGGGEFKLNVQNVSKAEKQIKDFARLRLPPEMIMRNLFVPVEGRTLAASDASQIEFRMFAHFSRDQPLSDSYCNNPDMDFHALVTRMMYPDITDTTELNPRRSSIKAINFGNVHGMGLEELAAQIGLACTCDIDWHAYNEDGEKLSFYQDSTHNAGCPGIKAHAIRDAYHRRFPAVQVLIDRASNMAKRQGYISTYMGRRRRYSQGARLHTALSTVIQGTAASYFKLKLHELWNARKELGIVCTRRCTMSMSALAI